MLISRLMTGVMVLALLVISTGCAADLHQTAEETIAIQETSVGLEQPAEDTRTFTIRGWVIVNAYHYDEATGSYVQFYHHEGSNDLTNFGLNFLENQLGDSPGTVAARYISLSNSTAPLSAIWSVIPSEINVYALGRANGTYTSTGNGTWKIENAFNATGTVNGIQLTGLNYDSTAQSDGYLFAAELFSAVNLTNGDSLTVTWLVNATST